MFNFIKKGIEKVKSSNANKKVIKENIDKLGKCYMLVDEERDCIEYIEITGFDTKTIEFDVLTVVVPMNLYDDDSTGKYGPFGTSDSAPAYTKISIHFQRLLNDQLNYYVEIAKDEFSVELTKIMDALLRLGY